MDDYTYTADDAVVKGEVEEGKRYTEDDFNRLIIIPEREAYRVKSFMELRRIKRHWFFVRLRNMH